MFDYISIELENRIITELLNNPLLTFKTPFNEETGELVNENHYYRRKEANFQNLKFIIKSNLQTNQSTLYLQGSIHKFHDKGRNDTDFGFNALKTALNSLKMHFNIVLSESIIHSLEFGVNIRLPFSCKTTLNDLLSYKGIKPNEDKYNGKGQLYRFRLEQYTVKVYNKGLQYFKNGILHTDTDDLMRFEIHVDRMAYLHNKDIFIRTLSDLLNPQWIDKLGQLLMNTFENLIVYDSRLDLNLTKPHIKNFLIEVNNPIYWNKLRLNGGSKDYPRRFRKFKDIIIQNTETDVQSIITSLIRSKWTDLKNNVPFLPCVESAKMSKSYNYIVGNSGTIVRRYCIVTGIDITHQSDNSRFVSKTTIDLMKFNNPSQYYKLLYQFPPKIYDEKLNERIAHTIRIRHTNPYHNLKRRAVRSLCKTAVFRADEVLKFSPKQLEIIFSYNK